MLNAVTIDCFRGDLAAYRTGYTVVAIDVVRATTTAVTAAAGGRRCFPVPTISAAFKLAEQMPFAILAGEQAGILPIGFHLNNSPSQLASRTDVGRPLILLSSSGTRLCHAAAECEVALVACLRNYIATANYLAKRSSAVALIGAGTHDEFREEDQMCCAWIAACLLDFGYQAADRSTVETIRRWASKPADAWITGKSARFLRESDQLADLDFILQHVADVDQAFVLEHGEVLIAPEASADGLDNRRRAYSA